MWKPRKALRSSIINDNTVAQRCQLTEILENDQREDCAMLLLLYGLYTEERGALHRPAELLLFTCVRGRRHFLVSKTSHRSQTAYQPTRSYKHKRTVWTGQGTQGRRQKSLREGEAPSQEEVEKGGGAQSSLCRQGPRGHNPQPPQLNAFQGWVLWLVLRDSRGIGIVPILETARARSFCSKDSSQG